MCVCTRRVFDLELEALFPALTGCIPYASRDVVTTIDNLFRCFTLFVYCFALMLLLSPIALSPKPTTTSSLILSVYFYCVCVRDVRASHSFLDSLVQGPRGPAPFLRIRAEYRDIFGETDVKHPGG